MSISDMGKDKDFKTLLKSFLRRPDEHRQDKNVG